jgi:transcriptional regulator with XRE-family HTH domain
MTTFAQNLRFLRKEKNYKQKQMADLLNITQQTYSKYENGQSEPSYETLILISNFFRVSTDYLVGNQLISPTVKNSIGNVTGSMINIRQGM